MRRWFQVCAAGLLLITSSVTLAQQMLIVADDDSLSAKGFRPQVGKVVTFVCPSTLAKTREIWGTDVYLDESPICAAALHAGVLTPGTSSQVTIKMGAGAESFQGTTRNGVTSLPYGPWSSTYTFIKNSEAGEINWYTSFARVPDDFHAPITVVCPPKGNADSGAWGTDVYTAGSSICLSAVHAGVITLEAGGRVTVTLLPKQETFVGSLRNGVTTRSWTNWDFRSFGQPYKLTPGAVEVFVPASAPAIGAGPRQPKVKKGDPGPYSPGPRTIRVTGFIAAGVAPVVVPHRIPVAGFTGSGTAPLVVPRSIRVDGWTGSGMAP